MTSDPEALMKEALAEAKAGLSEGGLPIGKLHREPLKIYFNDYLITLILKDLCWLMRPVSSSPGVTT